MKGALKGRVTPSMSQEKSQALPSLEEALFLRNKYHLRKKPAERSKFGGL